MNNIISTPAPDIGKTGFVYSEDYLKHIALPDDGVESPSRLKAIIRKLEDNHIAEPLVLIDVEKHIEIDTLIETVHPPEHIRDVEIRAHCFEICKLAAEGVLTAVDSVMHGTVRNAFCAVRPPGHHAYNKGIFGFCHLNNVAIAARYLQRKYMIRKILIVDWDYHHGNGTEEIFYDDPSVFYFSTHRLDAFPWSGQRERTGAGDGTGYNLNIPLPPGAGDREIIEAFKDELIPAAENFRPEFVLISAGFDGRRNDLLGDFEITDEGFFKLTRTVMEIACRFSNSRIVSTLEGGYNFKGLASAVEAHIAALST